MQATQMCHPELKYTALSFLSSSILRECVSLELKEMTRAMLHETRGVMPADHPERGIDLQYDLPMIHIKPWRTNSCGSEGQIFRIVRSY